MSSDGSRSRSNSPIDNPLQRNEIIFPVHVQGAIPKTRSPQPHNEAKEFDSQEVSATPHKDKPHSSHKRHKENQTTTRPTEENIKHKDIPPTDQSHNVDGANEKVKRDNREPKSASQKDRPHTESKHHGTTHDELIPQKGNVDRDSKPTVKKVRPHADQKHHGDTAVSPNEYEGEQKPTSHKTKHGDRRHHGDKRDDKVPSERSSEDETTGRKKPSSTSPKEKQQTEHKNEDTNYEVPVKTKSSRTKKNSKTVDQQKQADMYEGLPLDSNDKNNTDEPRPPKSTSKKERENAEQKKKRVGGTTSSGPSPESKKVTNSRNDVSLIFPEDEGNRSVMRIVVRSFATPKKSQNCVDVKIEGEKFNSSNMKNAEIENLIRELTKYVIQIQRALEEDDNDESVYVSKSAQEQHKSLEVVELFKRADKHSSKSVKEIKVDPTKSRLELGISMKFIPSSSGNKDHEKTPSQETENKKEQSKTCTESESSGKGKKEIKPNKSRSNKRVDPTVAQDRKKERQSQKDDIGQTQIDPQEKNGGKKQGVNKQNEMKDNERKGQFEGKVDSNKRQGSEEPPGVKGDCAETMNTPQRENTMGEPSPQECICKEEEIDNVFPEEKKGAKKRGIENIDTGAENPKKPKPMHDTESTNHGSKKRDRKEKQSPSKGESSPVPKSKTVVKKNSAKAMDGKNSFASIKSNVGLSKILVKLTTSKTLVAEGPTAVIRQKHKEQDVAEKGKETGKKKSRSKIGERLSTTKTVHIPVVFEETETAFQSKSSVKIDLEHSTDAGNISLNLIGIRNEDTQDFGGRIEFCQSYMNPKNKCEDVETMKELLSSCVKKVENVLNNLYLEQKGTLLKKKNSPKIKQASIEEVHESGRKPDGIIKKSSSGVSIHFSTPSHDDHRISFKDNVIDVIIPDGEQTEDECSGGPEGSCNECGIDEEDAQYVADKDVNEIVQAKLDAGEFDNEAKKSFERERFSISLKDTDAIERYIRNSRSRLSNDSNAQQVQEEMIKKDGQVPPIIIENVESMDADDEQNSSKINLALSLDAEDKKTTTVLGISTWPEDQQPQQQSEINGVSQPSSEYQGNTSISKSSIYDDNNPMTMVASTSLRPISADFENVDMNATPKSSIYGNSPIADLEPIDKDLTPYSNIFDNNTPIVMPASTMSRPTATDLPEVGEQHFKKKGCCELL